MKKVYSVKDIDDLHRSGALGSIPADAVITPSARDRLNELGVQRARRSGASPVAASAGGGSGDERGIDQSVRANSPKADLERLFNSPAVHELINSCTAGLLNSRSRSALGELARTDWSMPRSSPDPPPADAATGDAPERLARCTPSSFRRSRADGVITASAGMLPSAPLRCRSSMSFTL